MATVLTTTYDSVANSNALTITLASLATSSSLLVGQQSATVDNASTKYLDVILSGQVTIGTTPTAGQINVYVFAPTKVASSVYSWPTATATALSTSDASRTFEAGQLAQLRLAGSASTVATTDRVYAFEPVSVASLFGGVMPLAWGIFVTHNTAVNLNATAGNHWFHWTGITATAT